jgi:hypothetical protein
MLFIGAERAFHQKVFQYCFSSAFFFQTPAEWPHYVQEDIKQAITAEQLSKVTTI